jgi:hypothetical protein
MNNNDLDNKIVIYQTEDGRTQLDVKLENETVWLTQAQLVQLFDSSKANVSEHIKHIYEDGELALTQQFGNSELFKLRTRGRLVVM